MSNQKKRKGPDELGLYAFFRQNKQKHNLFPISIISYKVVMSQAPNNHVCSIKHDCLSAYLHLKCIKKRFW